MTDILTESFCERCGAKFTFETARKGTRTGLRRVRTLARGLRNYVLSDESIEEALAEARRDQERSLANTQLEAFHRTFNFCIDCRQYTCTDCWNESAGRCQSCAPLPEGAQAGPRPVSLPMPLAAGDAQPSLDLGAAEVSSNGRMQYRGAAALGIQRASEHSDWPRRDLAEASGEPAHEGEPAIGEATRAGEPAIGEPTGLIRKVSPAARRAATPAPAANPADPVWANTTWAGEQAGPPRISAEEAERMAAEAERLGTEPVEGPTLEAAAGPGAAAQEVAAEPAAPEVSIEAPAAAPAETEVAAAAERLAQAAAPAETEVAAAAERLAQAAAPAETEVAAAAAGPAAEEAAAPEPVTAVAPPGVAPVAVEPEATTPALAAAAEAAAPAELAAAAPTPAEPVAAAPLPAEAALPPAAAPEPAPVLWPAAAAPEPARPAPPSPTAHVAEPAQPVWHIVAPEEGPSPEGPAPGAWPPRAPVYRPPAPPPQPSAQAPHGFTFFRRRAEPELPARPAVLVRPPAQAVWDESSRGVLGRPGSGVQACVSCGLPLSASARFCRRCGSRQG